MLVAAVLCDVEPSCHQRQSRTHSDQRDEDDAEGDEQDHVAIGKGLAARQRERQCQRGSQRHRATHAGEGDHESGSPVRRGIALANALADQARQIGCRINPGKTCDDDNDRDQRRGDQDIVKRKHLRFLEQQPHLESRQQEQHALDQEDHEVPEENALQAGGRRDPQRAVPADVEAACHGRENAGAAEMFRNPVGEVGGNQRQRDLDLRIARAVPCA